MSLSCSEAKKMTVFMEIMKTVSFVLFLCGILLNGFDYILFCLPWLSLMSLVQLSLSHRWGQKKKIRMGRGCSTATHSLLELLCQLSAVGNQILVESRPEWKLLINLLTISVFFPCFQHVPAVVEVGMSSAALSSLHAGRHIHLCLGYCYILLCSASRLRWNAA